jgi:hypothetical protein
MSPGGLLAQTVKIDSFLRFPGPTSQFEELSVADARNGAQSWFLRIGPAKAIGYRRVCAGVRVDATGLLRDVGGC